MAVHSLKKEEEEARQGERSQRKAWRAAAVSPAFCVGGVDAVVSCIV